MSASRPSSRRSGRWLPASRSTPACPRRACSQASASLRALFASFLRPQDRVAAWGHYVVDLVRGAELAAPIDLRVAAFRAFGRRGGDVVQVAASLERSPDAPWASGRAGVRLAAAITVARALVSVSAGAAKQTMDRSGELPV